MAEREISTCLYLRQIRRVLNPIQNNCASSNIHSRTDMKQKITVLLEVKIFSSIQGGSINGDIFVGTSLYRSHIFDSLDFARVIFRELISYEYSGVPSIVTNLMEPDCITTISLVVFLIFRNGFRLSYFFGDNFGQFGWFDQKWRNPASFVRRARLIVLLVFS